MADPIDWGIVFGLKPAHVERPIKAQVRKKDAPVLEPLSSSVARQRTYITPHGTSIDFPADGTARGLTPVSSRTNVVIATSIKWSPPDGTDNGTIAEYVSPGKWHHALTRGDLLAIRRAAAVRHGPEAVNDILADHRRALVFVPPPCSPSDRILLPFSKFPFMHEYAPIERGDLEYVVADGLYGTDALESEQARKSALVEQLKSDFADSTLALVPVTSRHTELLYEQDYDVPSVAVNPDMFIAFPDDVFSEASAPEEYDRGRRKVTMGIARFASAFASVMHRLAVSPQAPQGGSGQTPSMEMKCLTKPPELFWGDSSKAFGASMKLLDTAEYEFVHVRNMLTLAFLLSLEETSEMARETLFDDGERKDYYSRRSRPFDPTDDTGKEGGYLARYPLPRCMRRLIAHYLISCAPCRERDGIESEIELKISQSSWHAWVRAYTRAMHGYGGDELRGKNVDVQRCMLLMWIAIAGCGLSVRFANFGTVLRTFADIKTLAGHETYATAASRANATVDEQQSLWLAEGDHYAQNVTHIAFCGDLLGALRHYSGLMSVMYRPFTRVDWLDARHTSETEENGYSVTRCVVGIPDLHARKLHGIPSFLSPFPQAAEEDGTAAMALAIKDGETLHSMTCYAIFERFDETETEVIAHAVGCSDGQGTQSRWIPWRYMQVASPGAKTLFIQIAADVLSLHRPRMVASPDNAIQVAFDMSADHKFIWRHEMPKVPASYQTASAIDLDSPRLRRSRPIHYMRIKNAQGVRRRDSGAQWSFLPHYEERIYGGIISDDEGRDVGIEIDIDVATIYTHTSSGLEDPALVRTNLHPIGRVDGYKVYGMPGVTLSFEILTRWNYGAYGAFDIFVGNAQLRGTRDAWTRAFRVAYDVTHKGGAPSELALMPGALL